jgi:hypothetical protein
MSTFQRDHDNEPVRSQMRALEHNHRPGHHVTGHGFIKPRSVVAAHDHTASVGHEVQTKRPRMHDGEQNAPAAKANAEFNSTSCCGMRETNKPGQIVASTKTS